MNTIEQKVIISVFKNGLKREIELSNKDCDKLQITVWRENQTIEKSIMLMINQKE